MSRVFSISYRKDDDSDDNESRNSMDSGDSATAIRIKRFPFEKRAKKEEFQIPEHLTPRRCTIKDSRNLRYWVTRACQAFKDMVKSSQEKRPKSCDSDLNSFEREFEELDGHEAHIKPEPIEVLCKLTKFTKQELQIMYRGFKQDCPSGLVKEDAFKIIYAQFFPRGSDTSQYAHFIFNSFDPEHTGAITFTDFVVGLSALARGTIRDKLRWAFSLYDIDGDGLLTKDELAQIVTAVYDLLGKSMESILDGRETTDRVFNKLDQHQRGVITLEDFIDSCLKDENITKSLAALDTIF